MRPSLIFVMRLSGSVSFCHARFETTLVLATSVQNQEADGLGFEPRVPARVQQFSRLPPSSTRPPIREGHVGMLTEGLWSPAHDSKDGKYRQCRVPSVGRTRDSCHVRGSLETVSQRWRNCGLPPHPPDHPASGQIRGQGRGPRGTLAKSRGIRGKSSIRLQHPGSHVVTRPSVRSRSDYRFESRWQLR